HWTSLLPPADDIAPSIRAQAVADYIGQQGASFFDELVEGAGLLRAQVEEALAELVSLGLVSSDSFGGLRALLVPSGERKPFAGGHRRRRTAKFGMEAAGRWALARRPRPAKSAAPAQAASEQVEHVARTLLIPHSGAEAPGAHRQSFALPRWPADCVTCRRRRAVSRDVGPGERMGGTQGTVAMCGTGPFQCFRGSSARPQRHCDTRPPSSGTPIL